MTSTSSTSSEPDLLYTDVEEHLRSSVRALLADRSGPETALGRIERDQPYDLDLWRTLAVELGAAGLAVPERLGGQGASAREVAVVMEELGAAVAPVPFLGSAVLATSALLACAGTDLTASVSADAKEAAELVARLAGGTAIGALTVPLSTPPGAAFPSSVRAGADGTLTGRVTSVADAVVADELVVPAVGEDGPGLYAVAASAVTITPLTVLDQTRGIADVALESAPASKLAGPDRAAAAVEQALLTGAGLLASEQLGLAQWCLDTTVRYTKERFQFGRPVGSFQALKHRMADVWLELVSARAAARYAAECFTTGTADTAGITDTRIAVAVAKSYCSDAAVHAAEECIQLHGGIGMTWEHPAHLYLKRAKSNQLALGTPGRHRAALAELADLPPPG